jgi:release factor glutamine methyltransferase
LKSKISHLDQKVLLQKVSQLNAKDLFLCDYKPKLNLFQKIHLSFLQKQREKGVPISYLTHQKEFYGRNFKVNKHTLIPRPETEQIIDICKKLKISNPSILDLGTGTGCIGITLLQEIPSSKVTFVDISKKALKVTNHNLKKHKAKNRANIIQSDLFSQIPYKSIFDVIVTNPPYIPENDEKMVCPHTKKYEPKQALFSGEDGLDTYREIFKQIKGKHLQFQYLIGEFGFGQKDSLELLLQQNFNGCDYKFYNDLNHIPRIFLLTHNEWN